MSEFRTILKALAEQINSQLGQSRWYLFGSARDNFDEARDIDLLAVCQSDDVADTIREMVDIDQLSRPIHLSILTFAEESKLGFIEYQNCVRIL